LGSLAPLGTKYYPGMAGNDRCLFCRIALGEIPSKKVYEDGDVVAFHDINPQAPTHVVVIPRKHIASLDDMTEADAATVGTTLVRLAQIARDLHLNSDGYRVVVNHGEAAGQTVFHIHFHLLGGRNFGWPPG
jgi:histidine triad (HIT) family protein